MKLGFQLALAIERPGDRHPPIMPAIESTPREAVASVLEWAIRIRRHLTPDDREPLVGQ